MSLSSVITDAPSGMDARDRLRSQVSFGLDPLACWSGIAGRTAGCCLHAHHPRHHGPAARLCLHHGPADRAGRSRCGLRQRAATFVRVAATSRPAPPSASPLAAEDGVAGLTTTSHAFTYLRHHPRPPMRPGIVPHSGQGLRYVGFYSIPTRSLSLSGRRRALPTSQWSWAVCRAALGVPDHRTVSPLAASGTFGYPCPLFPRETIKIFPAIRFAPFGISDPAFGAQSDLRIVPTLHQNGFFIAYAKIFFLFGGSGPEGPVVPAAPNSLDFPREISPRNFPRKISPRIFP